MKAIAIWSAVILAALCGIYAAVIDQDAESPPTFDFSDKQVSYGPAEPETKQGRHFFDPLESNALEPTFLIDVPLNSSLRSELEKVSRGSAPSEKYRAYGLIKRCMQLKDIGDFYVEDRTNVVEGDIYRPVLRTASEQERLKFVKFCGDLPEIIRRSRLDYLSDAASAGVAESDVAFMSEGPFGDPSALNSRPNDPLVVAWKQKALSLVQENADRGVISSIKMLHIGYSAGALLYEKDPVLALTYGYVLEQLVSSHPEELTDIRLFSAANETIKSEIPDKVELARSAANEIVRKIKERELKR